VRRSTRRRLLIVLAILAALASPFLAALGWLIWRGSLAPGPLTDLTEPWNARCADVPHEDRAFWIYAEAMLALGPLPQTVTDPTTGEAFALDWTCRPGHAAWEAHAAWAGHPDRRRAIELFVQASGMQHLGREYSRAFEERWTEFSPEFEGSRIDPPFVMGILLPELREFRQLARLTAFAARRAVSDGDAAEVERLIHAMFDAGAHFYGEPIEISQLVGIAVLGLGTDLAADGYQALRQDPDRARRVADRAAALADLVGATVADFDRAVSMDLLQRTYTLKSNGDGVMTSRGIRTMLALADPSLGTTGWDGLRARSNTDRWLIVLDTPTAIEALAFASRKEAIARVEAQAEARDAVLATPMWSPERQERLDALEALTLATRWKGRAVPLSLYSSRTAVSLADALGGARTRLRAAAHELTRGLQDGSAIHPLPPDPFTGYPLRFVERADNAGRVYYSVGADRNDDGARPADKAARWLPADEAAALERSEPDTHDGDWIVWSTDLPASPEPVPTAPEGDPPGPG
jgi:hypothetical protein